VIKPADFVAGIATDGAPPVVVLAGPEELFRADARAAVIAAAGSGAEVIEIRWGDSDNSFDELGVFDELRTGSLFTPAKVVVLRDQSDFMSLHGMALARLVKDEPLACTLVIEGESLATKKGRQVFLSKAVEELQKGGAGVVDCSALSSAVWGNRAPWDNDLARWLAARARAAGKDMSLEAAHALASAEGTGLRGLAAQLDRLVLHIADRAEITVDDVDSTVTGTKESNVFDLVDAAAACDIDTVLALERRLFAAGVSEGAAGKRRMDPAGLVLRLLPQLAQRFHQLGRLRELERDGLDFEAAAVQVVGEQKRWLFPKYRAQVAARSPRALGDAVCALADLEHGVKTGADPRRALQRFFLSHCRPFAARPGSGGRS
jgi:DNA polymerase III delta subunit